MPDELVASTEGPGCRRDLSLASPWQATQDTLWYYWNRYGRLVGYDVATRRCIGSLGPKGFAADLAGGGDRFSNAETTFGSRTLSTATAFSRWTSRSARPAAVHHHR